MPELIFEPEGIHAEVSEGTKILAAAVRAKVDIRYGCGALRCGTCAVKIDSATGSLSPMKEDERVMLSKLGLDTDGSTRMACRARIDSGSVRVDLAFQDQYSP